ncbi:hypothetical protein ATSB10_15120 [Dyella thiooxydans]|uniref:Uncharacterized protein n=1 Tax=Dyella thiooxydans TaxID=445710 RepID=A0A160MZY4_9GAMM|nr:hypothetical protein ATSB10_15120 [Dyella thiooxydans]
MLEKFVEIGRTLSDPLAAFNRLQSVGIDNVPLFLNEKSDHV